MGTVKITAEPIEKGFWVRRIKLFRDGDEIPYDAKFICVKKLKGELVFCYEFDDYDEDGEDNSK